MSFFFIKSSSNLRGREAIKRGTTNDKYYLSNPFY